MKKIAIHSLLGIILLILLNQLAIHSAKIYKDGASIICEAKRKAVRNGQIHHERDKTNVLFMGASGMLAGLNPQVFDSLFNYQVNSINMALPALPIASYYHYLKDYLDNNPAPAYIIMTLQVEGEPFLLFNTYANQGINFPDELLSYFWNRKDKNQVLNYLLPVHVYRNAVFQFLSNGLLAPEDITETRQRNQHIIEQMVANKGYYFIQEQAKFPNGQLPNDYSEPGDCDTCLKPIIDPFTDPYVDKFFTLTQQQGIEIMLVTYPTREGKIAQYRKTPAIINRLVQAYPNISLPPEGWKFHFYANRFFSDPHHLNKAGSDDYTKAIATRFKQVYPELLQPSNY